MKSITVHKIDKPLAELIESKARSEGLSISKTIPQFLLQTSYFCSGVIWKRFWRVRTKI